MMFVISTYSGFFAASLHACLAAAPTAPAVGPVSTLETTASEDPVTATSASTSASTSTVHKSSGGEAPTLARGRELLISGGIIGGVGLLTMTVGFGVLGGIHLGNPGPKMVLEFDDLNQGRRVLRTANAMAIVGVVGATMSVTGVILGAVGGTIRWRGRRSRLSGMLGPGSAGLSIRF